MEPTTSPSTAIPDSTRAEAGLGNVERLLDSVDLDTGSLSRVLAAWLDDTFPPRAARDVRGALFEAGHLEGPARRDVIPSITLGPPDAPRRLIVTSGIHGVEGRFGLLLQLRFLASLAARERGASGASRVRGRPAGIPLPEGTCVVLPFALNAEGFARSRRWCGANSDLNRGFFAEADAPRIATAPPWPDLHARFGPRRRRPTHIAFAATAARLALKHGWKPLVDSLPQGQSEYADFIFFNDPRSPDVARVKSEILRAVRGAARVVHVDLHTGYGARGEAAILTPSGPVTKAIGKVVVIYPVKGSLTDWSAESLGARGESCVIEFGTVAGLKVFFALLRENHSHWTRDARLNAEDRRWVLEAFFPADRPWREGGLRIGLEALRAALDGLAQTS